MSENSSDRERRLFDRLMALPESQWSDFLDHHCADDAQLRGRLGQLLDAHRSLDVQQTAAVAQAWSADDDPETIGPYRVGRRLGEGGMGVVYYAEQEEPIRRRVAVKVIKPGMDSRQVLARFESERQTLALLNHPGIARVLDAGDTARRLPYFVMEFVDGEAIDAYCDRHRLSIDDRLKLFIDLCDAVQHAHMKGIIHRDLKPSNILVTGEGGRHAPKVIDFGIAKALASDHAPNTRFTALGQPIGTPDFMSPEQASGREVDTRTDVYSLGVVLYELLTGVAPLQSGSRGSSPEELQRLILEVQPPRPSRRLSGDKDSEERAARRGTAASRLARRLGGELDVIVMKALEKDPDQRYSSVAALGEDLRRYRTSQPILARPPSTTYQFRKLVARHKGAAASVVIVLTLLVAFAVTMTVQARRIARARDRAEAEASKAVAINEFLQGVLQAADPWGGGSRELSVVDAVDDAVEEIDAAFEGQPLIEAAVRVSVGTTYRALGRYDDGERLLKQALALRKATLAGDHPEVVEAHAQISQLYLEAGRYDDAERHAREALAMQERLSGPAAPEFALREAELAACLDFQGKFDEAEPLARHALAVSRAALGDRDEQVSIALETLGAVLWQKGKPEEAEPLVVEALEIYRDLHGNERPQVHKMLTSLGLIRMAQGNLEGAEADLTEALEVERRLLGDEHPIVAIDMENLANVHYRAGRLDETIALLDQVLEMRRRNLGEEDVAVGRTLANMAAVYSKLERWEEAEQACRQALSLMRAALNPEHPSLGHVLGTLKRILIARGNSAGAADALMEIVRIKEATLPRDDESLVRARAELAELEQR